MTLKPYRKLVSAVIALTALALAEPAGAAAIYGKVYDTLRGRLYPRTRLILGTQPPRETTTDDAAQYWFRDVAPGAYLIRIVREGEGDVVGRLVVAPDRATTIVNLDLSKIEAPHHDDAY
ncbi:carboxypeptidase-like regulatory domain-containing protein [Candidatus Methylocalor cossyra]|uniref:Protocatechuate 3,4-dioxygenase beta subunit n=1 Tax=Candidatus Methylocalor cossyra TaxID=3108543 RepID=A0ABM9NLT1_9GAMM